MPPSLPMTPPAATQIGGDLSMQTCKDWTTYFANLVPIDRHSAEDVRARQCRMARLHLLSGIRQEDVAHAFEVSLSTVTRSVRLYRERGEEGFRQPRRGRGRVVLDAGRVRKAEALLAGGMSGSAAARRLGIPVSTFNENRRAGVIGGGGKTRGSSRSECDSRDREAPMGRATHDVAGRVLAMTGQMEEARPTFGEPAHGVAGGGVLAGLPMLLREGLLGAASRLLGLPNGFYGVASVLLFVAFLALARVRNAESLRYQAPGEWGILLGLDRCPEVKTLRRKIRLMAGRDGAVHAWQDALARQWMAEDPEACATLAVDGHVKTYSGRKGKLPKHFVAWQKLVPAGQRLVLGQRPGWQPAALPAQGAGSEDGESPGGGYRAAAGGARRAAGGRAGSHRAGAGQAGSDAGLRPRGLEPGAVPAPGAARHRRHHLAQRLQGGGLARGGVPPACGARLRPGRFRRDPGRPRGAAHRTAQRVRGPADPPPARQRPPTRADHHPSAAAHGAGRRRLVLTMVAGELLQVHAPGVQP